MKLVIWLEAWGESLWGRGEARASHSRFQLQSARLPPWVFFFLWSCPSQAQTHALPACDWFFFAGNQAGPSHTAGNVCLSSGLLVHKRWGFFFEIEISAMFTPSACRISFSSPCSSSSSSSSVSHNNSESPARQRLLAPKWHAYPAVCRLLFALLLAARRALAFFFVCNFGLFFNSAVAISISES